MIWTVAAGGVSRPARISKARVWRASPGEDGDRFSESDVAGGLAAAEIVVVECGQIVVNERVGMEHLDGCAKSLDAAGDGAGDGSGGLHGEYGTKSLAAGEDRVAHGAVNGGRYRAGGGDQGLKRTIGEISALQNQGFHIRRHPSYMITE